MTNNIEKKTLDQTPEESLLEQLKPTILDPLAQELVNSLEWITLKDFSQKEMEKYPVVFRGKGPKVLLIHGFDSSFLEFRRLVPLLEKHYELIIPDIFGFGFCPRPINSKYGPETIVKHLNSVIKEVTQGTSIGIIGASMGGAIAMQLAKTNPTKINRLLLLAPAGLTGRIKPVPIPFDQLGVCFLSQTRVRKKLCEQAFADPKNNAGDPEEQIASLHLNIKGWRRSLAAFARSGGFAGCGSPLPKQPFHSIWGKQDRILKGEVKQATIKLLRPYVEEIDQCGHLPHIDQPEAVAKRWINNSKKDD